MARFAAQSSPPLNTPSDCLPPPTCPAFAAGAQVQCRWSPQPLDVLADAVPAQGAQHFHFTNFTVHRARKGRRRGGRLLPLAPEAARLRAPCACCTPLFLCSIKHTAHKQYTLHTCRFPPQEYEPPSGSLEQAIEAEFGALDALQKQFNAKAAGVQVGCSKCCAVVLRIAVRGVKQRWQGSQRCAAEAL